MYLTFFTYTCKHKENIRCKFISLLYIYTLCHQCKSSNSLRYLCTYGKLCEYSAMLPCHPLQTWCKSINLQYLKKYVQRCENIKFATHLHHLYNICKCMFLSRDIVPSVVTKQRSSLLLVFTLKMPSDIWTARGEYLCFLAAGSIALTHIHTYHILAAYNGWNIRPYNPDNNHGHADSLSHNNIY